MALVVDSEGVPIATGMGWDTEAARPSNQEILDSSLGSVIRRLQTADKITPLSVIRPDDLLFWWGEEGVEIPEGDDTELLQWSLLVSRVMGLPLYFNRQYTYSTGVLEAQQGQTIYGNGPNRPGLRMAVAAILESENISLVNTYLTSFCHAPDADAFTIRDLQIDGGQSDIDWATIAASGQYALDLSQVLRETPGYSGLGFANHGGRSIPSDVILENIHVHDTCGTCLFGFPKIRARNITLGNSVSGRVMYRLHGECQGLHTYGYTRTSIARVNVPTIIDGWTYEGRGYTNPWPANANQDVICSVERLPGESGSIELRNVNWDGSDSELIESLTANENCKVTGFIKNLEGPYASPVQLGPYSMDFDLVAVDCAPPNLAAYLLANIRSANIRWVHKTEARDKTAIDWSYTTEGVAEWGVSIDRPLTIAVARQAHHAADHEQRINIHFDHDWPQWLILHIPDLTIDDGGLRLRTASEVIPTYVTISGRIDNRLAAWVSLRTGEEEQFVPEVGELAALPIRIIFNGLACNEISPGNFRGDDAHTVHSEIWQDLSRFPLYSNVGIP